MLHISNRIFEELRSNAENDSRECCGFLFGTRINQVARVSEIYPVENACVERDDREFLILPLHYLQAEEYALINNLSMLGIYHSHPESTPYPSGKDIRYAWPGFSYLIMATSKGKLSEYKCWRFDNHPTEEQIFLT